MTTIKLCGRLQVSLAGRDLVLPGRQGRCVFAYLVLNRRRAVPRDELLELLWPGEAPADPADTLSALLSRVRRSLGPGVLEGRGELTIVLPDDVWVDCEAALAAGERAATALAGEDGRQAVDAAREALEIAAGGFLPGVDLPWLDERRRELEDLRLRALEVIAEAGPALGGADLAAAERAAREVVQAAPFRESGHRLLMEALAARGDVAEALRAYEQLRVLLRDELGAAPGPAVQAVHRKLLTGKVESVGEPQGSPPAERKLVAVLCAEPAPPGDPADPEDLRDALAEVQGRLRAVVERFGGAVHGPAPAPALFGAAETHEDDAERAIRAALAARERGAVKRAAVASGEAIVEGSERSATGQVVARAAKLLAAAPAGAIAVDEETARAARRGVEFETRGDATVVRSVRDVVPGATPATPLVGRARELATLAQLHGTVIDRESAMLVTLAGQAGIGKSRLAEEFARRAEANRAAVYRGRCLHYGEGISFWPLREILCDIAGIGLDDPAETARRKLKELSTSLALADATTAALAASAGIALDDGSLDGASPGEIVEHVGLAWPSFLSACAGRGPLVLVVEDLHWAEPELLAALERIATRSEGPLMLLATARPEFAEANPGWTHRPGMSHLALDALSAGESRELVGALLPEADDWLRERVAGLAEGNPFFAEEIARHIEAGGDPSASLPHGVRALLAARIDALPAAEKSALQHASVVGRRFWLSALEPNLTGQPLPGLLASLEERGLVVARPRSALPDESEFWFSHGLTREVAYHSIPRAARSRTHAAVAAWIERLAGDRREEFIYLLAYHYEAAAQTDEEVRPAAVETLLEAGSAARRGLLSVDPIGLADRALALAGTDRERLAALELRARGFHAAVRGDEALAAYLEAIELAHALQDRRAAANLRSHAALLCTRYMGAFSDDSWVPAARALVEQGLAETDQQTASFELGALLLARSWGKSRWRDVEQRDVPGARRDVERALEIAEEIGSNYLLAHALEGLTWLVLEEGFCEAEAMGERLERAAGLLTNRVEAHESLGVAAICFARAGRFERARTAAAETTRQAVRLSPHRALHAGASATVALVPPGRFAELRAATERVGELAEREGHRICATGLVALAGRALAVYEAGEEHESERMLALLRRLAPSAGTFRTFGHPAAQLLRPVLGPEATMRFIEEAEWRGNTGETVVRLRALLSVFVSGGDPDELRRTVAEARALAGPACAPALGWIADLAEAGLLAREGDVDRALAQADRAAAALDRHGERYTAARYLAELLPGLKDAAGSTELAQRTAARLTDMGALASARLLLASSAPWQPSAAP